MHRRIAPRVILATAALLVALVGCVKGSVTPEEARAMIGKGGWLIDVRSPQEYAGGSIPGAVNMPFETLWQRLGELPRDKPIILFCDAGVRSARAQSFLREKGFAEVYNLGSVHRWR